MTTLTQMARAIWIEEGYPASEWDLAWKMDASRRSSCLRKARAALEALREPSEGMVDAGENPPELKHLNWVQLSSEHIWQAMIDHALNEPEPQP